MLLPEALSGLAPSSAAGTARPADLFYPPISSMEWSKDCTDTTPTHYYVWCDSHDRNTTLPRDADGVIMVRYWNISHPVYNPTTIGNDALSSYETYLHVTLKGGDAKIANTALADFMHEAKWLRDKGMDSKGRFTYTFDLVTKDYPVSRTFHAPWYSAMAQGLAISVFTRAYAYYLSRDATEANKYLDAAKKAFLPFQHDLKDGGVTSGGGKWFEEYPDGNHVLNGSIFAMFGVYDLWRVTQDQTYKDSLDAVTNNLAANLYKYESHGAILYELVYEHFSHPAYYILQNRQLEALSYLTGSRASTTPLLDGRPSSARTPHPSSRRARASWRSPGPRSRSAGRSCTSTGTTIRRARASS